jgi:hypothetical protein
MVDNKVMTYTAWREIAEGLGSCQCGARGEDADGGLHGGVFEVSVGG